MVNSLNTSLNAIQSHFIRLQASADNIANLNTDGYKGKRVIINQDPTGTPTATISTDTNPGPSRMELNQKGELVEVEMSNVDLATEYVKTMESTQAIKANLKAAQTTDELLGEIINTLA
ncbi:MAG: flagellar basal body rod C-terminal domain-containing protein [Pseudomonadota bacterium]|nr:flagellar basal body rod C-terminal domain-containing protein [Pseudomonadota bacterium]